MSKRKNFLMRCSLTLALIFLTACAQTPAPSAPENAVTLLSGSLADWYRTHSSTAPDPRYFGAYVMAAVGNTLYLGLSTSVPIHAHDGALIARFDDDGLNIIPGYAEQDIDRMVVIDEQIFIPGYDPLQGWDAGNLYILDAPSNTLNLMRYRYDQPHFVAATETNQRGEYAFNGLKTSSYSVRFIAPPGWRFTTAKASTDYTHDSNADAAGSDTTCSSADYTPLSFMFPPNENTIDAGLIADSGASGEIAFDGERDAQFFGGAMRIGDYVWHDENGNGFQDTGESGFAGVRVELYTRDPYFPCVIHANGLSADAETGEIFYNGGTLPNTNVTFRSGDGGATWDIWGQHQPYYWAYDFIRYRGEFYRLHRSFSAGPGVYNLTTILLSSRDGFTWTAFPGIPADGQPIAASGGEQIIPSAIDETNAIVIFRDEMIVLHPHGDRLYRITSADTYDVIPVEGVNFWGILPDFPDAYYAQFSGSNRDMGVTNHYNVLANANDEQLYVIGADNAVYVTDDLTHWRQVADFHSDGAPLISLTYWAERDMIIAATAGDYANLYAIERAQGS